MIEKDSVCGEDAVSLPIIFSHLVCINLRGSVRTSRVKRSVFVLGRRGGTKHFGTRGLVEARIWTYEANCLQQPRGSKSSNIPGIFGLVKGDPYVGLRSKVVNFVRLNMSEKSREP